MSLICIEGLQLETYAFSPYNVLIFSIVIYLMTLLVSEVM
jgi:hypothetical protein